MPEHAPEPWTFTTTYEALLDARGRLITVVANESERFPSCGDGRGEFHRIVACVNACKDFSTKQLEAVAAGRLSLCLLAAPDPFAPEIVEKRRG